MIITVQAISSFVGIDHASTLLIDTVLALGASDAGLSLTDNFGAANTSGVLIGTMAAVKEDFAVQVACFSIDESDFSMSGELKNMVVL